MPRFFRRMFYYPLLALFSRQFYVSVVCRFTGASIKYLLELCLLASIVSSIAVYITVKNYINNDLVRIVEQIPSFRINSEGEFVFLEQEANSKIQFKTDKEGRKYVSVTSPAGRPMILFNPDGASLELQDIPSNDPKNRGEVFFHVSFNKSSITINNGLYSQTNSYKEMGFTSDMPITGQGIVDSIKNIVPSVMPPILFISLFIVILLKQCFAILITFVFSFGIFIINRVRMNSLALFRINVYANTAPLVIFVVSLFFIDNPALFSALNNVLVSFIPLIYVYFAAKDLRNFAIEAVSETNDGEDNQNENKVDQSNNKSDDTFIP